MSRRVHKLIRRAHMYLGLALIPWVLLFGVSGFLFNHHSTLFGGNVRKLASFSGSESAEIAGVAPLDVSAIAAEIVRQINDTSAEGEFRLVNPDSVRVSPHQRFQAPTDDGNVTVALNLVDGSAVITRSENNRPMQSTPTFAGQRVQTEQFDASQLKEQADSLVRTAGIDLTQPLSAGRRGPELRFQLSDQEERKWNTVYELNNGQLWGRAADDDNGLSFSSAVTRLHKTHNYPDLLSARWIWVMIADATALTMVFWGISGLVMWWKIRPTKVIGSISIGIALAVATIIVSSTLAELTFSPSSRNRNTNVPNIETNKTESTRKTSSTQR